MTNFNKFQIQGVTDASSISNVSVTREGHLETEIHGPVNPFGSIHVENLKPIFQADAVYGFTYLIKLQPGESLTVAAKTLQNTASWVSAAINTREDQ